MKVANIAGMKCPRCSEMGTRTVDSRPIFRGTTRMRRRYCPSCQFRFTTYERSTMRTIPDAEAFSEALDGALTHAQAMINQLVELRAALTVAIAEKRRQ